MCGYPVVERARTVKMSEKKRQEVYAAISNSIMETRIDINKSDKPIEPLEIDGKLFNLEICIWKRVKQALNLDGF